MSPTIPTTPHRAERAIATAPFSHEEANAETQERPHLHLFRYQGKLSADLRYRGGVMTGDALVSLFLFAMGSALPPMALVVWAPEGETARIGVTAREALDAIAEQNFLLASDASKVA